MLVYRDRRRIESTTGALMRLRGLIRDFTLRPSHETAVRILIELGMLEAAVADARHPRYDEDDDLGRDFRAASLAAGHLVRASWWREPATQWREALERALATLDLRRLPGELPLEVPEGFAQYGLFPECYLDAADRCLDELGAGLYVCLGLRGIGTSLSALVAARLESRGVEVRTFTVRPRGHPFDRRVEPGPRLAAALAQARAGRFLVIDEGPGLSGSSLTGTAAALANLGIADERIVFLPSWNPDGDGLRSPAARARWPRHRRYTVGFEETWLRSGRLADALGLEDARDLSAGAWRTSLLPAGAEAPAVHPHHERRKYLAGRRLASFAGLAGLAERRAERARALAEAGFGPTPITTHHGFLLRELAEGVPLHPGSASPALLDTVARYLAYLRRHHPADRDNDESLSEMVDTNVAELLGPEGVRLLARHRRDRGPMRTDRPVALDARMLAHEWLRCPGGYLKVDALDHHDDHFYPGPCDIAWDLAASCVEFDLDASASGTLLERYRRLSGDRSIGVRLPAYAVGYLAFRAAYARLAAETLAGSADGRRYRVMADSYSTRLRLELSASPAAAWSA
jgi:hypothetical protein